MPVSIQLSVLRVKRAEGDGLLDSKIEPYLWPVFFKIDGVFLAHAGRQIFTWSEAAPFSPYEPDEMDRLFAQTALVHAATELAPDGDYAADAGLDRAWEVVRDLPWSIGTVGSRNEIGASMASGTSVGISRNQGLVTFNELVTFPALADPPPALVGVAIVVLERDSLGNQIPRLVGRRPFAEFAEGVQRNLLNAGVLELIRRAHGGEMPEGLPDSQQSDEQRSEMLLQEVSAAFSNKLVVSDDSLGAVVKTFDAFALSTEEATGFSLSFADNAIEIGGALIQAAAFPAGNGEPTTVGPEDERRDHVVNGRVIHIR